MQLSVPKWAQGRPICGGSGKTPRETSLRPAATSHPPVLNASCLLHEIGFCRLGGLLLIIVNSRGDARAVFRFYHFFSKSYCKIGGTVIK